MDALETMTYAVDGPIARITLDRPDRGNGITQAMPRELADCVERANLDPAVHVIALAGNGNGFCGGYDLVDSAEALGGADRRAAATGSRAAATAVGDAARFGPGSGAGADTAPADPTPTADPAGGAADPAAADPAGGAADPAAADPAGGAADPAAADPAGAPTDPATVAANHDPAATWDPVVDFQMMWRNLRGFMSLFHSDKPVVCRLHGFCVAGGTDMALCSDLIVTEDRCKIGYPPARVWGVPTSMLWAHRIGLERARRLLLTGDSIDGTTAVEWGLASEAAPLAELDGRFEALLERIARVPVSQLVMHKLAINQSLYAQGLQATQAMSVFFDGIARHTPEGYGFQRRAAEAGFRQAVRERDEPFGDFGLG